MLLQSPAIVHAAQHRGRRRPPDRGQETTMQAYDLYLNPKRPTLGLYVKAGAALPGLADKADWQREGTVDASELPPGVAAGVDANGHAFQELGG